MLEGSPRPDDPKRPQVCLDAASRQLLGEVAPPQPVAPGGAAREDYEDTREGVCNLFVVCVVCAPLVGRRHVTGSHRRTRLDWAYVIQDLVDVQYPDAEVIGLVAATRNTHTPAALYEAFDPAAAKRLADKLETHPTPKHGSWRTMAAIAVHVLAEQCLDRRLPDRATVERAVAAWDARRNAAQQLIAWRFTTADARIKLKHLYPAIQD